jgi:isoleucyl-tRNA synthetase
MGDNDLLVGVNTVVNEQLEREGIARDIVRRVQALRKEADFDIDDHIATYYSGDPKIEAVFKSEAEYIQAETLSDMLIRDDPPTEAHVSEFSVDGLEMTLGLVKM